MRILSLSGEDILATQHLRRWHMVRVRRQQTLAEHLSVVAMLSVKIAELWRPHTTEQLLTILDCALTHDLHEVEYGDPPSPAVAVAPAAHAMLEDRFWKQRPPSTFPPQFALDVVRVADKVEAALFYLLEGEDPRLKVRCEESVRMVLERTGAPLAVSLWLSNLFESVRAGAWTPQPGGRP